MDINKERFHAEVDKINAAHSSHDAEVRLLQGYAEGARPRAIVQMDLAGNTLSVFDELSDAAAAAGVSTSCICNAISGHSKTSGGFKWARQ